MAEQSTRLYEPVDLGDDGILYFLHIPKTAGTSLTAFIEDHFPVESLCPERHYVQTVGLPVEKRSRYRCFCGHQGHHLINKMLRPPVCVTMLRDPVRRSLSHYAHIQRTPAHPLYQMVSGMTFEEFVRHPAGMCELCNFQTRFLGQEEEVYRGYHQAMSEGDYEPLLAQFRNPANLGSAMNRLESFAFAGLVEQYDASVALMCHVLGWPVPEANLRYNMNPRSGRPETLGDSVRDVVMELTTMDQALYSFVAERLQARLERFSLREAEARLAQVMSRRPVQSSVHLRFEKGILGTHWLGRETMRDGQVCRWTGPHPEATLNLRLDPAADLTVQFCAGTYETDLLDTVQLFVHEQEVPLRRYPAPGVPGHMAVFRGRLPRAELRRDWSYTRLKFRVQRTSLISSGQPDGLDDRSVGLFFRWIDVF